MNSVERRPIRLPFADLVKSFVSGSDDDDKIRIDYSIETDNDTLYAQVHFGHSAEGPPGHAHGGAQAAVLDEMCGGVAWTHGHPVLAAKLETEFFAPVPLDRNLCAESRITERQGRKLYTHAQLKDPGGTLYAHAKGLFIILQQEQLEKLNISAARGLKLHDMHSTHSTEMGHTTN